MPPEPEPEPGDPYTPSSPSPKLPVGLFGCSAWRLLCSMSMAGGMKLVETSSKVRSMTCLPSPSNVSFVSVVEMSLNRSTTIFTRKPTFLSSPSASAVPPSKCIMPLIRSSSPSCPTLLPAPNSTLPRLLGEMDPMLLFQVWPAPIELFLNVTANLSSVKRKSPLEPELRVQILASIPDVATMTSWIAQVPMPGMSRTPSSNGSGTRLLAASLVSARDAVSLGWSWIRMPLGLTSNGTESKKHSSNTSHDADSDTLAMCSASALMPKFEPLARWKRSASE